jgi:hypothetical protein
MSKVPTNRLSPLGGRGTPHWQMPRNCPQVCPLDGSTLKVGPEGCAGCPRCCYAFASMPATGGMDLYRQAVLQDDRETGRNNWRRLVW